MTVLIIIGAIIVCGISSIVNEGGFLSKASLCGTVAAPAFLLLKWITQWDFMGTMAKISAVIAVLCALLGIIGKIVD